MTVSAISVCSVADLLELARRFTEFTGHATPRAPLYARLSTEAAATPAVLEVLQQAPEQQQLPVLLFAAVHHLLLAGEGAELARHYPNLTPTPLDSDPSSAFRRFVVDHAAALADIVSTRSTQTNEVGRCAQFLPALGVLDAELGELAQIDVGTSAGLNLLLPRYRYQYEPGGTLGPDSPVTITCSTTGGAPIPASMPRVIRSVGVDASPIDVTDDDEVRWLEACVWPDQADRFARLVAAIELARATGVDVRRGDAVTALDGLIDEARQHAHPVVTNSWVLNYLSDEQRLAYVAELDRIGDSIDLSWLIAESPAATVGLPVPTTDPPEDITVLTMVRWRNGLRTVDRLATVHPHGYWMRWEGARDTPAPGAALSGGAGLPPS
jgi:hypothetical protein